MGGKATNEKLKQKLIKTIGDLANSDPDYLHIWLGKHGDMLYMFANGYDNSTFSKHDSFQTVKSIGNSITTARYLHNNDDVKIVIYTLAKSVARGMRNQCFKGESYINQYEKYRVIFF